ncbi:MAG: TIGR03619 family F420-dependent LLM class oxidoreductase [Alphaproteobacteria bacterium]|nr:TIGR03619 family F420-dependent LLM class oxidoreductase [Alphaproteobacteria bacterium]
MRVGVVFPQTEIPPDPAAIRDWAQAVEGMGFDHLIAYDHVIGANTASRPGWNMPYTHDTPFHEPLTLFAYLAGVTTTLELASGIVILPQRQAALFAKQAANADVFSGGRIRLGFGIGWNQVEYEALGVPFERRGARLDEQVDLMRRLWTGKPVTYDGRFHKVTDAGINPPPVRRSIPVWFGGTSEASMDRVARTGDGWIPVLAADKAKEKVAEMRDRVKAAGRDPGAVGIDNIIFVGNTIGGPVRGWEDAAADHAEWQAAGASHVTLHTMGAGLKTMDAHLDFLRRFKGAIA